MVQDNFYTDLPSFADFGSVGDLSDYVPVPSDWVVLASDIVRSSDAIAAGRYKDVNMIAAAVIASVLNRLGRDRVPFLFGGDGAMLLVPERDRKAGAEALAGVARLARDTAGLDLRAAAIPVAELRRRNSDIKVRKYALSPDNFLAMVIGDGLALADRILKDPDAAAPFTVIDANAPFPDLEGLSCRWEPLPSLQGRIVSIILKPIGAGSLPEEIARIANAIGFDPLSMGPNTRIASLERLKFRFPPRSFPLELALKGASRKVRAAAGIGLECLAFLVSHASGLKVGPLEPARYLDEIGHNTDHRKLGDSLQLVLDLPADRLEALKVYLEEAFADRRLVYGLHESDSALMTCFVQDLSNGQHIHFVDGANGGFCAAAEGFKDRLTRASRLP